jgi:hypothetical protein
MTMIYSDEHAELLAMGKSETRRASHVEPCGSKWTADMSPVGGPLLGPFDLRQQALDAEVAYLNRQLFEDPIACAVCGKPVYMQYNCVFAHAESGAYNHVAKVI